MGTPDRDSTSNTGEKRISHRIPGIRKRAPRRNALVTLAYLASFAFLASLFGRLLGLVP